MHFTMSFFGVSQEDVDALYEKKQFLWQRENGEPRTHDGIENNFGRLREAETDAIRFVSCPVGTLYDGEKQACRKPEEEEEQEIVEANLRELEISHVKNRPPTTKTYIEVQPAQSYTTIEEKRNAVQTYLENIKSNPIMKAALEKDDVASGALCHLVANDDPDDDHYGDRSVVVMPWQLVGNYHVLSDCRLADRGRATIIHHGMGTGKSLLIGMIIFGAARHANTDPYIPWILFPKKQRSDEDSVVPVNSTSSELSNYVKEIVRVFWQGNVQPNAPDPILDAFDTLLRQNATDMLDRKAGVTSGLHRFTRKENAIAYYQEVQNEPTEATALATDWFQRTRKTITDRLDKLAVKYKNQSKNHIIIIDESDNFFKTKWRFAQLMDILHIFKNHQCTKKLRFVFASGTPFAPEHPEEFDRFQKEQLAWSLWTPNQPPTESFMSRLSGGVPKTAYSSLWSVSLFDTVPPALGARLIKRKIDIERGNINGMFQYFSEKSGVEPGTGDASFNVPTITKIKSAQPIQVGYVLPLCKALEDFMTKCAHDVGTREQRHHKCVIVIPNAYAQIQNDVVQSVSYTRSDTTIYSLIKEYIASRFAAFNMRKPGSNETIGISEYDSDGFANQAPDTVISYAFYDKTYKVDNDEIRTGDYVFGRMSYLDEPIADVDARRLMMGFAENPPSAQILFVDSAAKGLDLAGVSTVYFLHDASTVGDFLQLMYRGVRLCSTLGFPDNDFETEIVTIGFEMNTDLKEGTTLSGLKRLMSGLIKSNESEYEQESRKRAVDLKDDNETSIYYSKKSRFSKDSPEEARTNELRRLIARHNFTTFESDEHAIRSGQGEFSTTITLETHEELYNYLKAKRFNDAQLLQFLDLAHSHYQNSTLRDAQKRLLPSAELVNHLLLMMKGAPNDQLRPDSVPLKVSVRGLDVILDLFNKTELLKLLRSITLATKRVVNPTGGEYTNDGLGLNDAEYSYSYLSPSNLRQKIEMTWDFEAFTDWNAISGAVGETVVGDNASFEILRNRAAVLKPKLRFQTIGGVRPIIAAIELANQKINDLRGDQVKMFMQNVLGVTRDPIPLYHEFKNTHNINENVWNYLKVADKIRTSWNNLTDAQKVRCANTLVASPLKITI